MRTVKTVTILSTCLLLLTTQLFAAPIYEQWHKTYDGTDTTYKIDQSKAVAVDSQGNVIVAGNSYANGDQDIYVIKYSPSGTELWSDRYDGDKHSRDSAFDIAVDANDNIYVTGSSPQLEYTTDIVTIKYEPNGTRTWLKKYDGSAGSVDTPVQIILNDDGSFYICGSSIEDGDDYDMVLLKYDSNGTLLWNTYYDYDESKDETVQMAIDSNGYIYLVGSIYKGPSWPTDYNAYDFAMLKVDPNNGNQEWTKIYDDPMEWANYVYTVAIDSNDGIYVGGTNQVSLEHDMSAFLFKYNTDGNEIWRKEYDSAGYGINNITNIAIDSQENIHLGVSVFNGSELTEWTILKYETTGNLLWTNTYTTQNTTRPKQLTIGSDDTLYVAGMVIGNTTGGNITTIRYSKDGERQWVISFNGSGNGWDTPYDITTDDSHNIYVTGEMYVNSTTGNAYVTIKYAQTLYELNLQTSPAFVDSTVPRPGIHLMPENLGVQLSAEAYADCPDVYTFSQWTGDINDTNAVTTITIDANKTVTAEFINNPQCGDACHDDSTLGDHNHDCVVDFADFSQFAANWLSCTKPSCD